MTQTDKNLHAVDEDDTLTQEEQLEAILFQFVNLYERWAEDRQKTAKQGADIEKFIKQFASEVDRFSAVENAVIAKLKNSLDHTTVSISEMVHGAVSHAVDRSIDDTAKKIKDSALHAENIFSEYQSSLNWSHWKLTAITALSSIVASLLIVWWLMPKPTLPLTDAQITTYRNGLMFNGFWPKLSKRQQNWLLNVAVGKENNKEKLVEDVKKQYPDISDEQANQFGEY
jgi:hypothetical protein